MAALRRELSERLDCARMAKVCHSCGKGPAFGQSRSHSMVATKRRFDPNLQKVQDPRGQGAPARVRVHALPESRQGHQGPLRPRRGAAPRRGVRRSGRVSAEARPPIGDRGVAVTDTNLVRFRAAVAGALAHLESRREEVNDLNVFPVADGDTGDNMALTLRAVLDELDRLQGSDEARTIDEIGREEIVQSVARAALLGRARQLRRDPLAADPRRRRGARQPPGRADRRDADRRGAGQRRRPRLLLGARARRGHDPDRRARDGPPDRDRRRAQPREPALGPATEPRRAGRGDRRDARARGRRRPGVGQARPRAARGAARRRRRRRRRLRADDHLRRRRRGAARRRSAGARPPRAGAHQPPRAQLEHLSLLHELRRHRQRAEPGALHRAARGARRLGAGRGRRDDAEGARAHRRARAGHRGVRRARARSRGWTSPTCACRSPSATSASSAGGVGAAPRPAEPTPRRPSAAAVARRPMRALRRGGGRQRRRARGDVRRARRAHDRRRPDAQPLDLRPARRRSTRCRPRRWWCCRTAPT